ncbi:MAG: glycosyltransferase family protein [Patescibacteria group bacterium]|nr:glycosyltransferase family protein [Patescibacteria group bacterium]
MLGIIVQARTGSTRLPKKMLKKIQGKYVIEHVLERVKKIHYSPKKIVLATTDKEEDGILEKIGKKHKCLVHRGRTGELLKQYYDAAKQFGLDPIVRITADCPLLDRVVVEQVIEFYLRNKKKFDYVSNVRPPTFPDGLDVEVFSFKTLGKCRENAKLKSEREHVTPYIAKHPEIFRLGNVKRKGRDLSALRLTLDEPKDLILIRKIYGYLYPIKKFFGLDDMLKLFGQKPELLKINQGIGRNEGLLKSIKEDKL